MSETTGSNESDRQLWTHPALVTSAVCLWVLTLLGVGYTGWYVVDSRSYIDCQRDYNSAVAQAVRERGEAGELDRSALKSITSSTVTLVNVLLQPGTTQQQRIEAIQSWRDTQSRANKLLDNADQKRSDHPIPQPRVC